MRKGAALLADMHGTLLSTDVRKTRINIAIAMQGFLQLPGKRFYCSDCQAFVLEDCHSSIIRKTLPEQVGVSFYQNTPINPISVLSDHPR